MPTTIPAPILPNAPSPLEPFPAAATIAEEADRFRAAQNVPGFWDNLTNLDTLQNTIGAAYERGSIGAVPQFLADYTDTPDHSFTLDDKTMEQMTFGIDPRYWDLFENATSWEAAQRIRQRGLMLTAASEQIAKAGGLGTVADIGAQVFSPENVVATIATMGIGSFAGVAKDAASGVFVAQTFRGANLARAAGMGFINAGATLPIDAIVANESPDLSGADVFANFAGGLAGGFASDVMVGQRLASKVPLSSRSTRFALAGGAQGLGTGAVQAFDDDKSAADMATAFVFNLALGGALNAIPSSRDLSPISKGLDDASRDLTDRANIASVRSSGVPLSPEGKARADALDLKTKQRAVDEYSMVVGEPVAAGKPDKSVGEAVTKEWEVASGPQFAIGAASQKELSGAAVDPMASVEPVAGWKQGYFYAGGIAPGPSDWGMLDFLPDAAKRWLSWSSMGGIVQLSTDKLTSFMGKALGSFGLTGQSSLHFQRKQFIEAERGARFMSTDPIYKKYVKEEIDAGRKPLNRDAFSRSAFVYMHQRGSGTNTPVPIMDEYANAINAANQRVWDMTSAYDKDAGDFVPDTLSHYWNGEAIDNMVRNPNIGYDKAVDGIAGGIYAKIKPDVGKMLEWMGEMSLFPSESLQTGIERSRSIARAEAERIVENAGKRHEARVASDARVMTTDTRQLVSQWIDDTLGNKITAQQKSDLLFRLGPTEPKTGPSFLRERIPVDPEQAIRFKRVYGDKLGTYDDGSMDSIQIADLMEQNVEVLHDRFLHQASSHAALQELMRVARKKFPDEKLPDSINSFEELSAFMQRRAETLAVSTPSTFQDASGKVHKVNPKRFAKDAITIDVLLRQLHDRAGFDVSDPSIQAALVAANDLSRLASSRAIGHLGMPIQNAATIVDILSDSGWKHVGKVAPGIVDYVNHIRTGTYKPGRFDIMVAHKMGWGLGPVNNRPMSVMFDDETGFQKGWLSRFSQNYSHKLGKLTGDTHTNAFAGVFAHVASLERFHDIMVGGEALGERFLRDYELSAEDAIAIRQQYLKHHRVNEQLAGAFDARTSAWDNKKAAALYTSVTEQYAARSMNLVDKSKRPRILANPLVAPMGSLRSWAIAANDNYALRRVAGLHDREGFNSRHAVGLVAGTAAAASLYALRTYVMSIGRPDQKEYLERMLSTKSLVTAGLFKHSAMSLYGIPTDAAFAFAGKTPPSFNYRVSNLKARQDPLAILTSTPLFSYIDDATQAASIPFRAAFGDNWEPNQSDTNAALNSFFVPNLYNLRNGLQRMYDDLPKNSP